MKSSIITQIYIDYIRLAVFLNKTHALNFSSSVCLCDQIRKIAKHVIIHYNKFAECWAALWNLWTEQLDIKRLINNL